MSYLIKLLEQTNFLMVYCFLHKVYVFAIILCKIGPQYYLVDSHARDTEGKPDANGSGIISKSENILELISYITDIDENTLTMTQYEL